MEQITAKFNCHKAEKPQVNGPATEAVELFGVYGGGTNAEDNNFATATPYARVEMSIDNPGAQGFFKPGKQYKAVFTEVKD